MSRLMKTNQSRWSAVITSYNSIELISKAINSALQQSIPPLEVLVVDDCSTDGSYEFLLEMAESNPKIKVFQTSVNSGGAATPRNLAITAMNTPIGIIFDDDDFSFPERAACHLAHLSSGASISYVGSIIVDPFTGKKVPAASSFCIEPRDIKVATRQLLLGLRSRGESQVIVPSSVSAFLKQSVVDIGCFDPNVLRREDIDLAIRILQNGTPIIGTDEVFVERLVTAGNDKSRKWDVECEANVFRKHRKKLSIRLQLAGKCLYKVRGFQADNRLVHTIPYAFFLAIISPKVFTGSLQRWLKGR
jgi:GT2 family glycosyltransferase